MPEVEEYRFGYIRIAGEEYTRDVIVYPDRVRPNWWRKEGHRLSLDDLEPVLKHGCDTLVIGTGAFGIMKVPSSVLRDLEKREIEVIVAKTKKAVKELNKRGGAATVCGALHLTC